MMLKQTNANFITETSSAKKKLSAKAVTWKYFPPLVLFNPFPLFSSSSRDTCTETTRGFIWKSFTSLGGDSSSFWSVFGGGGTLFFDSFFVASSRSRFFFRYSSRCFSCCFSVSDKFWGKTLKFSFFFFLVSMSCARKAHLHPICLQNYQVKTNPIWGFKPELSPKKLPKDWMLNSTLKPEIMSWTFA